MIETIRITIQQAIAKGNSKKLRECFYTLRNLMSEGTNFNSEDLDFLASLVEQQKFLDLGGGWYFVMLSQVSREDLSFHKSEKVDSVILTAYDALEKISPKLLCEAIEQAIESGEEMQMEKCASAISTAIARLSYFPDKYFNLVIQ